MSIQSVVESAFGYEDVSNSLWNIIYSLFAAGVMLVCFGVWVAFSESSLVWYFHFGTAAAYAAIGLVLISAGLFLAETGQVTVPANPVSAAILTIWGKRLEVLVREGRVLRFNFWPFYIDYIIVDVSEQNLPFCFTQVRCAATYDYSLSPGQRQAVTGGTVSVSVSMTVTPNTDDAKRIIKYLNYGGIEKIKQVLEEVTSEGVRHTAIKYDWETFVGMKAALTVMLLVKISEVDFRNLKTNSQGLVDESMYDITPDGYKELGYVTDPIAYLFPERIQGAEKTPEELIDEKRKEQEIEIFLRIARIQDLADIMDLGVKIARLNIPAIEPEGAADEGAELAAREAKEREAELADTRTTTMRADAIVEASKGEDNKPTISYERALEIVRIGRGQAKEIIIRGGGELTGAAAIVAGNLNK